jgi:hypothetical protein
MTLPAPAARIGRAGWLDNRHIVFTGFAEPADAPPRVYVQSIADGTARPITGDGVTLVSPAPDGTSVLGRSGASFQFHQLEGGATRPVAGLRTGDVPIEWTRDGQALYVVDGGFGRATPSANVVEVDLNTGRRSPWKTIIPADPVGVDGIRSVAMMPDGSTYCYSYIRRLGDLYVAEGLK